MNQYIFDTIFTQNNNGKIFDYEAWESKIDEITAEPLDTLSPEKQQELIDCCINLDSFAKVIKSLEL
jgi:hypothetical protein